MELVAGRPVDEVCAGLPLRERLALFREVCAAVHFAHQNLVVHRDLKPGNILVTADGAPKLLDFGIAKLLDPGPGATSLSELGLRPMTLQYASPEQVQVQPITTASDVYTLGVLLHVLLTGRSPYGAAVDDWKALEKAIVEGRTVKASASVERQDEARGLAGDLDTIVLHAMHLDPRRRYASAEQLAADIQRYLDGLPVLARKDTAGYRFGKFIRRHKAATATAAAVLLLVLGFSVTVTLLLGRAQRERHRAETVSEFLEELFAIPDPSRSRGETITAREVLDRGRKQIAAELKGEPETQADLMDTMGRVYHHLGLLDPARELLTESLRVRRRTLGDHLDVASSLQNLAVTLRDLGEDREAEPLLREALAIRRRHGDTATLEYTAALNDLAGIKQAKGELQEAEALFAQVLALKRRLLGPENEEVALGLHNLAAVRHARGDFTAAEPLYRQALAMRRRLLGELHPDVATTLNNLASLLADRGDPAEAEKLYREVLAMRRKLFGAASPRVASSLNNLAFVLLTEGRPKDAEPFAREALSIVDALPGGRHPNRAVFLRNLAAVLAAEGKGQEGEPLAREALASFRSSTSSSTWRAPDAESVLGSCLVAQGRFTEAEPLLLGSYPLLKADSGDGARYAPAALQRIVDLYAAWGRPDRAAAWRVLLPSTRRP
jgi:serine/threonine-protein kinase